MPIEVDVAICGGGLAGLTLARQLKLQLPQVSVAVLDKLQRPLPQAAFKVGEAVTEAAAYYLAETLQLRDYLARAHCYKLGFRFFFGDAQGPFHERPEFGLSKFPAVSSYTLDRGILENDLRQFNEEAGVVMLEGCAVEGVELSKDGGRHQVHYRRGKVGEDESVQARWVVDATGRRRLLQGHLGMSRSPGKNCSAVWFRLKGRVDVCDLVPREMSRWHDRVADDNRYYSVNHLMGRGYWVWIIPLSSGHTSVGIVALEDIHPFAGFNTRQQSMRWLERHEPALSAYIAGREVLDFRCMRRYSRSSRKVFSADRWACVGDAAVFADPFYAPAADLIALGNLFTAEMIRLDLDGKLTEATVRHYDQSVLSLNDMLTRNIQVAYPLMGNAVVMASKVIWDTAAGWSLLSPQIFNSVLLDPENSKRVRRAKGSYFFLTLRMQELFTQWGARSLGRASFEFVDFLQIPLLLDLRKRNLRGGKTVEELVEDHRES
ncbi:MAG: NAD(P)/FAD-dependent oxidoreductase, partial [Acidobacteria bacterium]